MNAIYQKDVFKHKKTIFHKQKRTTMNYTVDGGEIKVKFSKSIIPLLWESQLVCLETYYIYTFIISEADSFKAIHYFHWPELGGYLTEFNT